VRCARAYNLSSNTHANSKYVNVGRPCVAPGHTIYCPVLVQIANIPMCRDILFRGHLKGCLILTGPTIFQLNSRPIMKCMCNRVLTSHNDQHTIVISTQYSIVQ
jgi:hypothetical protein